MAARSAGSVARRLAGAGLRRSAALRDLPRLVRSGILDREYYAAQAGRSFASDAAAARHYLLAGRRAGLSPHPLYEPEWLTGGRPTGRSEPWLAAVRRGGVPQPGPLFDAAAYRRVTPAAGDHPGGPLGHFAAHAPPSAPLPGPAGESGLTWGEARAALLAVARDDARRRELRRSRRTGEWDAAAERRFLAAAPGPAGRPGDEPLVTVVLPVRNRPHAVRAAVASVVAQTFGGWELVAVDDGSDDATPQVLAELAAADPRVRVVTLPPSGVCAARNAGIAAGRAPWVAFLDSDNAWEPHFLRVMLGALERGAAAGARAAHAVVDSGRSGSGRYLAFEGGLDELLVLNHVDLNTLVADRALLDGIGGFDPALRRWVDHDLAIRLARRTAIPLVPFVGVRYDDSAGAEGAGSRITVTESDHWQYAVLGKALLDWDAHRDPAAGRVPGRVTVSMPTYEDWSMTVTAVRAVLAAADADGDDVEVRVVDNGSRRAVAAVLAAAFLGEPRVRVLSQARNLNFAIGSNLGAAAGSGDVVVFLNNDTRARPGWLAPLRALLADPAVRGAQPLLLYPDGTVQSAGTAFPGEVPGVLPDGVAGLPAALLAGHAAEDARGVAPIRLPAVTAAALAMRFADVAALRGFDPIYVNGFEDVDLCLRAVERDGGAFAVATDAVVVHDESRTPGRGRRIQENRRIFAGRFAGRLPPGDYGLLGRVGLRVARFDVDAGEQHPVPRPVLERVPGAPPRWALKVPVTAGPAGDGDPRVATAAVLAEALRALGQHVVVDRLEAWDRPSAALDDEVVEWSRVESAADVAALARELVAEATARDTPVPGNHGGSAGTRTY